MLRANRRQAQRLYQTLREHLGQSPEGQELLAAFELNPESGSTDLAAYLRQQLPEDEALARKLALALESEAGAQQVTVVAGGQVDQIVNIARLGVLNLTVKRHLSVFRDVRQLVVFLAVALAVGVVLSFIVWRVRQPAKMTGDFNIAVAKFGEVQGSENAEMIASDRAANISNVLFNFLGREYDASGMGLDVQVAHKNMPLVIGSKDAADLAKRIGADVVIFGTVQGDRDQTEIQPRFWVAENAYSPELTGQTLSKPIQFDTAEAATSISPVNVTLTKRAQLLVQLTQALVYLKSKRLDAANTLISSAIAQAENESYFKGEEVLYLLRSTVTRKQKNFDQALQDAQTARQLNPTYARGWLAEGNVYYDMVVETDDWERYDLLDLAMQSYYSATLQIEDAPVGAYIREKAVVSLGNTYLVLAQNTGSCDLSQPAQASDACDLFQQAMDDYGEVISLYEQSGDASYREDIQEQAAIAYFGMGAAYERQNLRDAAIEAYHTAAKKTRDDELKARAEAQIAILSVDK